MFGVHAAVTADTPPTTDQLAQYLQNNALDVTTDTVDGYQQVYYHYQGQKVYITGAVYNHTHPAASGEYVVWEGLADNHGQIYLYDVLTDALIRIVSPGTSENPSLFQDSVVWEEWLNDSWQIFYYNGFTIQQVSVDNVPSVRPSINAHQVIYAEQFPTYWQTISYDIASGQRTVIMQGDESSTAYPHFAPDGTIRTGINP